MLQLFEFFEEKLIKITFFIFGQEPLYFFGIFFLILAFVFFYIFFIKNKVQNPGEVLKSNVNLMIKNNEDESILKKEIYYFFIFNLKCYLKNQIQLNLDSKTDAEIIDELTNKLFDPPLLNELELILQRAYDSRFAGIVNKKEDVQLDVLWLLKLQKYVDTSFLIKK